VDVQESFPPHGQPAEQMQQGETLRHDLAQLAQTPHPVVWPFGMIGSVPQLRHAWRKTSLS
jgi:hypothetical protein